jgi:MFS family permease
MAFPPRFMDIRGRYSGLDRRVWILFAAEIMSATGFSVVMPFLSIYFNYELEVPMNIVGLIWLVIGITSATGQTVGGHLADLVGRRKVMYVGLGVRALTFLLISFAVASQWHYTHIAAVLAIGSFCGGTIDPAINAMVADVVEPSMRLEAYGLVRVGINIGWAIGPMMGGLLAAMSYSSLFTLTAITTATFSMIVFLFIPESMRKREPKERKGGDYRRILSNRTFLMFCVGSLLLFMVTSQMGTTLPTFSRSEIGLTEVRIGLLYSINGAMVVLLQMPIARYLKRFALTSALIAGALLYTTGYFCMSLAGSFAMVAMCMATVSIAEIVISPTTMAFVAKVATEEERGRYMGVFGQFAAAGWAFGPFYGGTIQDSFISEPMVMWGLISLAGVASAVIFLLLRGMLARSDMASPSSTSDGT